MHARWNRLFSVLLVGFLAAGCGRNASTPDAAPKDGGPAAGAAYRLADEPAGAQDVRAARSEAKDGDEIVVIGRVGGEADPWVKGVAAFTIVDNSLKPCIDDGCSVPWDYCCDSKLLPVSKALVQIVDGQGKLVQSDSRELLGIRELQTVVVRGKARKDDAGNLTIAAGGIFVRP